MIIRKSFSQFVHEAIAATPLTTRPKPTTPPAPTSTSISRTSGPTTPPPASTTTSTPAPAATPAPSLSDLRSAAAKATMAGPSREAQALMSPRAKAMLGQSRLDAGIQAQQGVETMKASMPSSTSTPLPAANATWAKANPKLAAAYAERQRIRGTAQTDNPMIDSGMRSRMQLTPSVQSPTLQKDLGNLAGSNTRLTQNPNAAIAATPKPTATAVKPQVISATGGAGGKVTVGTQYPAVQGGQKGSVTYNAQGQRTFTPATAPTATPTQTQTQAPTATPTQTQAPAQTSGLTDAEKKRIDDFRALSPLQKLQQRGQMEKELSSLTPEQRKQVMDYYNR